MDAKEFMRQRHPTATNINVVSYDDIEAYASHRERELRAFAQKIRDNTECVCKLNVIIGTAVDCWKCEANALLADAALATREG